MAEKKVRNAINFIKDFLKERGISIQRTILFGSYVTETFTQDSDVDIAIISKDFEGKDTFQRAVMLKGLDWALVERFMLPFDIVPISLKEWHDSNSLIVEFVHQGVQV